MAAALHQDAFIKCDLKNAFALQSSVQISRQSNTMLITENPNLAISWNTRNNVSSQSWTFASTSPLTCPMLNDPYTGRLVAVRRHQALCVFKPEEDLSQVEELALLPHMRVNYILSDRFKLYVWLTSGEVYPLNQLIRLCGYSLPEDHSLQDLTPAKPLFRFEPNEKVERILDIMHFNRQYSLGFVINLNGQRYVSIYRVESDNVVQTKFILKNKELDLFCYHDRVIVVEEDYRVYLLQSETRTLLYDLSLLAVQHQIVRVKYLSISKELSCLVVVAKDDGDKHKLFVYDPTYRTESQHIKIEPLLLSYVNNLFYLEGKVFVVSQSGVQSIKIPVKRLTLVEAISNELEQRKQPNGNIFSNQNQSTIKEMIANLSTPLKPRDLERNLARSIDVHLRSNANESDESNKLLKLLFSFNFAHNFLVEELRSLHLNREQLARVVEILNEQLNSVANEQLGIVFDWTGALFDAYFIAFNSVTNKNLLDLLKQTQTTLEQKLNVFHLQKELYQTIQTGLETLPDKRGKILIGLPDHKHLGYKFEEIYL